ncbi:putative bifunctional methylthioribulose-1-phosphate dehydratase/enolase-phosphatase E1 1 isoform X2 [Iris pallida]|uniref:Bifunctional methylthioribulose-1-phosphate dehydratase/enolase-phosphatase E1 1 isoform X2 n=1 Tax=Iris pallida TaxID=29817 RepID=A0AAX6H8M6_IRIPA|nr:putative bifunctional methylthioribulose-1-phosphate dehydratase/enolase-phosphatase E1 1 isoform X2 [Iris pallida]
MNKIFLLTCIIFILFHSTETEERENERERGPKMAAAAAASLSSQVYLEGKPVKDSRAVASHHCRNFYGVGWVTGTGGSIAAPKPGHLVVVPPSTFRAHKERVVPEAMYVLSEGGSVVLSPPSPNPYANKPPKCMDCAPLLMKAECYHYPFNAPMKLQQLGVDWTTPSHGPLSKERHLSGLVRAEPQNGYHAAEPSRICIVLDIEGTTTPISFVTDVLFPYARDNVRNHLTSTFDSKETKDDIDLLRAQVNDDLEKRVVGSVPIPPDNAGKEKVIDSLVTNVEAMIKADRKITALKQLQGHIWRTGFGNNELQGIVFEDVPEALKKWHANGIKVYIYSSGSREAQRLIFGNTTFGDLRKYLCGFFDTSVGNKRETRSYFEISQSVGVDKPSEILFVTDVYQEAVAAKAAGLEVMISIRPGNAPLPENHGFETIRSFAEI